MKNLPVAYKSQWDADAGGTNNDCGPASIAMILNYYGENLTTDQVFKETEAGSGLIGIDQMKQAIARFGYSSERRLNQTPQDIKNLIDQNLPFIALVHYGSLKSTQDKKFKGGHFFCVVGYREDGYFVNDPNFKDPLRRDGDHHFYTKEEFEQAWKDCTLDKNQPNSLLLIKRNVPAPIPPSDIEKLPKDSVIGDVYQFLTGERATQDTIDWRLSQGKNIVEIGLDICNNDKNFYNYWIKPHLQAELNGTSPMPVVDTTPTPITPVLTPQEPTVENKEDLPLPRLVRWIKELLAKVGTYGK